jgi:vacuolar-type H+-ATPase subunit I/STV1
MASNVHGTNRDWIEKIMTKLEISGKYEIGNGYSCHCCRRTDEREFEGLYLDSLIKELIEQSTRNDGDVVINEDDITISNMGAHHDQYYIKEEIVKRCEAAIKKAYEIKKLKKQIDSTQSDIKASNNWLATVEQQRAKHLETVSKKQAELEQMSAQLKELSEK